MLNKNFVILLLSLIIGQFANAQVTGNIQLVDIYGNLLTDHSGTMVVFEPKSGGAVQDTVYTDVNGDFSITLVSGQYRATYSKLGYGGKWFPRSSSSPNIQAPNATLPNDKLYELLPIVYLTGSQSGVLLPFTHYRAQDTLTIPAGDTLRVPEGAWLNFYGGTVIINGHLEITGTSAFPAVLLSANEGYGGYEFAFHQDNYLKAGGSVYTDSAKVLQIQFNAFRAAIELNNTTSQRGNLCALDTLQYYNNYYYSLAFLDESELTINESSLALNIESRVNSKITGSCNYFRQGIINLSTHSSTIWNSNYFAGTEFNIDGADTLHFSDNYFAGPISIENAITNDTSFIELVNNNFQWSSSAFYFNGKANIYAINNVGLTFFTGSNPSGVTIKEARYNILYPDEGPSIGAFLPLGSNYPVGMLPLPQSYSGIYIPYDTLDVYGNRYITLPLTYLSPVVDSSKYGYISNTGDPSILDPDGSRSDRGARYAGCLNPLVLQPNTTPTPIDSVYPGDANYDGTADNFDLLPIGYLWGETGPVRTGASLAWVGQYTDPWTAALPNGRNAKHADCDGSGLVDYDDVAAIYQNYGLTHTVQKQPFGDGLWLQFPSDSIFEGDTAEIKVMLGTTTQPVTGIAGLAFSITYDPAFVKPGSAKMDFDSCWLGTDSVDLVTFHREDTIAFRNDIALSRTDRVQLSGSGHIGTLIVVINDDILAKDSMTLTTFMDFVIIGAKDASYGDKVLGGNYGDFNVQVGYERLPNSVENTLDNINMSVYPNPATDRLHIRTFSGKGIASIYGLNGRLALRTELTGQENIVDIDHLGKGFYVLKLEYAGHTQYLKLIID